MVDQFPIQKDVMQNQERLEVIFIGYLDRHEASINLPFRPIRPLNFNDGIGDQRSTKRLGLCQSYTVWISIKLDPQEIQRTAKW